MIDPNKIKYDDAVIELPRNAVKVSIEADVYENGEIGTVRAEFNMDDIREAFRRFEETVEGDYPLYTITEEGKAWLEQRMKRDAEK